VSLTSDHLYPVETGWPLTSPCLFSLWAAYEHHIITAMTPYSSSIMLEGYTQPDINNHLDPHTFTTYHQLEIFHQSLLFHLQLLVSNIDRTRHHGPGF